MIGREICPKTNGNKSVLATSKIAFLISKCPRFASCIIIDTKKGVIKIPNMPEIVASKTAPATLPFPIPVSVTDDEMVDDRAHK